MGTNRIILDSGALSAVAREEEAIRVALRRAMSDGADVIVPAVVIAECITGDARRDARVNRILKAVTIEPLDERTARAAGTIRHAQRRRGAGTVDAMVVACADASPGSTIYTSDPSDLKPLAAERGRSRVVAI